MMQLSDRLVMYTDGVTEAINKNEVLFGEQGLQACIQENVGLNNQALCNSILEAVNNHQKGLDPFDDTTLVFFQRRQPEGA